TYSRRVAKAASVTTGDKVNVAPDIASNSACTEGHQTSRSYKHEIHAKAPEHLDEVTPLCARLLQAIGPELKQKFDLRIFFQNALCPLQGMQFVALNIDLDQINAFPGFEIIVQRHHFNLENAT